MKDVEFIGNSDEDLREFPHAARQRAGFQLYLIQIGKDPFDWKPMTTVGSGCREIRIHDSGDAYRVFYVATIGDSVYVLHCFQKKNQRTASADIDLGKQRYKIMKELIKAKEEE